MSKIDKSIDFVSINICVITISDTRNEENDKSGNLLQEKIINFGHNVKQKLIISDDLELIKNTIKDQANNKNIDAIITTGGTGLTGRDSTPEVILKLADKMIEGFGEFKPRTGKST